MTDFSKQSKLQYQGLPIHRQPETGLVCLTDIWKAQCSPAKNRPSVWLGLETTQALLKRLIKQTGAVPVWSKHQGETSQQIITEIPGILDVTRVGEEFRTYSTAEIAVVYARFLSVEGYEWALANLVEGREEEANYLEHVEARTKQKRQREFSRRALIAAGWAVPVVLSVALNQKAVASGGGGGHVDVGHIDTHIDGNVNFTDGHVDHNDFSETHQDRHTDFQDGPGFADGHVDSSHGDGTSHIDTRF